MDEWIELPATEKEDYLIFHSKFFEEDLKHAEKNMLGFPRWSIISGYYCMHNITKLFLAKRYNIKILSPEIHSKTIKALEKFIREEELKKKLLELLKKAKETYYNAERLKERVLPALLRKGREERIKSQYYTQEYSSKETINNRKSTYFLETIVKPYIKIIKELME